MINPELYIVIPSYAPNTATTNRIFSFIRGFSEQGMRVEVTFLISDYNGSRFAGNFPFVSFCYLWNYKVTNSIFRQLQLEYHSRKYVNRLPKGSKVFLLWPSSRLLALLTRRSDLHVYYEETELPELYSMRTFNFKSYIKSIHELDHLFVISTALKDYFVEKGLSSDKVDVINMIVDSTRFDNIEKNNNAEKYIAYCGTVTSNKDGVDCLIKAFAIVSKKHPDVKLYIIGAIPQRVEENVISLLVDELDIKDKVVFTGVVSYQDMPKMLKDSSVLALARPDNIQAKYGFPTKLGEYLLTGNPVVVTRVGDIPLFLKDGESAYLAVPNNPENFASRLLFSIENEANARNIGRNGMEVALKKFNYLIETKKILEVMGLK